MSDQCKYVIIKYHIGDAKVKKSSGIKELSLKDRSRKKRYLFYLILTTKYIETRKNNPLQFKWCKMYNYIGINELFKKKFSLNKIK